MASQARRAPLCGQRGRRRLRGQLGRQRILLVDGRVCAARAVVVGGSAAAGCAAGITTLTLLTWIVFAVAAWEGRGMVRFSGVEAAECCVPTEKMGLPPEPAKPRWVVLRCVRTWLASSSVSVDRALTAPSSSAAARSITSADTPSSPANLCTSITFAALSRSVVASTVTECRSTQRPGAVRSSRSLPQFTIARGGNPVRGWLLSGVGRKARPTVRGRTAGPHGHALRGAVLTDTARSPPSLAGELELDSIRGLCVTVTCAPAVDFRRRPAIPNRISSLCR